MSPTAKYADDTIELTADGRWLHGGVEITHERTRDLFFKSIVARDGKFFLTGEKAPVPIEVEDAPYFVKSWERKKGQGWGEILLSDGEREPLNPATLDVGPGERLSCRVKGDRFKAVFERKVYYELMKNLVERDGFYGLIHDGVFYPLKRKTQSEAKAEAVPTKPPRVKKTAKKKTAKKAASPKVSKSDKKNKKNKKKKKK